MDSVNTENNKDYKDKLKKISIVKSFSAFMIKIAAIVLILSLVFTYIFAIVKVKDEGMYPSIKSGDLALIDRWKKNYIASDVIALKYDDKIILLRVVAKGGDKVEITSEGLLVNGILQKSLNGQETLLYEGGFKGSVKLEENEVFVLGDKINEALDSRIFGPVKIEDTIGSLILFIRRRNF